MAKLISVIVPCYNEQEVLHMFYDEMSRVAGLMTDYNFEFIFVNDGSRDNTLNICKELAAKDERVKYISFSRNFGKEAGIYAGFEKSKGDLVCMMDADLQDPPALLPEMVKAIEEEGYDSVATRRVTRKGEPPIRSFFARMFYKLMNKISKTEIVDGARDYRLMTRQFVNSLLDLGEYNRFSKGLFGWVGYKTKWLEYENIERAAGETKWSFWKLLLHSTAGYQRHCRYSVLCGFIPCHYIYHRKNTYFWRPCFRLAKHSLPDSFCRRCTAVLRWYIRPVPCQNLP